MATGVFWNLEGLRLLVSSGRRLQLYQHRMLTAYYNTSKTAAVGSGTESTVSFTITDEDPEENPTQNPQHSWLPVWETILSAPARYIKYSPDGALFATCGDSDRIVKIWYQDSGGKIMDLILSFSSNISFYGVSMRRILQLIAIHSHPSD